MPAIKARYWLLTIPVQHHPAQPQLKDHLVYIKGQQEIGEQGLHHWQLLACFDKQLTLNQAKTYFCQQAHLEKTRSSAADEYVWKDDTSVPNTRFELGQKPFHQNSKTDWSAVKSAAKEGRFDDVPDNVYVRHYSTLKRIRIDHCQPPFRHGISVLVYWGGSGLGKTRRAWHEAGEEAYIKDPCTKWWDGYRGQKRVIIDEFTGVINIAHILRWIDRYPCMAEIKGCSIPLEATEFWITSNIDPRQWYPDINEHQLEALLRRMSITHFLNEWLPPNPNPPNSPNLPNLPNLEVPIRDSLGDDSETWFNNNVLPFISGNFSSS